MLVHVALFAGAALAAVLLVRDDTPPRVPALAVLPASTPDLSDPDTRQHLGWLARHARSEHLRVQDSLYYRCRPGAGDSYAVHWSFPDRFTAYVEVLRDAGSPGATALSWPDPALLPPPPPLPPGHVPAAPAGPAPPPRRHAVSAADFSALERAFVALAQERPEPVRSGIAIDGGGVELEFCRGGRYGVFVRMNHFSEPDDRRVLALGRQMLALTGIGEDKVGKDEADTDSAAR